MQKEIDSHSNFMLFILRLKLLTIYTKDHLINVNVIRNFIIAKTEFERFEISILFVYFCFTNSRELLRNLY